VDVIKKLEVNKLIKELDFIKSDFNYKSELVHNIDKDFIRSVEEFLNNHPRLKKVFDEKVVPLEINVEKNTDDTTSLFNKTSEIPIDDRSFPDLIEKDKEKDKKLKSLYRSIVKSTHPDKIKDSNLQELYLEATNAYEVDNILPILAICDILRIPYEISEDEISLIRDEINNFKNKINFLETTYTWKWVNSESKDQIVLDYIKYQLSI